MSLNQWGQTSRIHIRFTMITEDQHEPLAIQWHGRGRNIEHPSSPPTSPRLRRPRRLRRTSRTLNIRLRQGYAGQVELRSEEKRSLAEDVRRMCRPFRAWNPVCDGTQGVALGCRMMPRWGVGKEPGERLNKERRYPIALPMSGPLGSGLPRFMGFPWTSADGFRRSLIGIAPLGRKKGTHAAFGRE
jgi:hypothetical protein